MLYKLPTMKGRVCVFVSLYLWIQEIVVTVATPVPCSRPNNGSTTGPCIQTTTPGSPASHVTNRSEEFLNSPYVFMVLCSLVLVPFLILVKVWWVKRLQKAQYVNSQQRRRAGQQDEVEIYVIDQALFAPPPSYEDCMAKSPSYDCLPAYKDLNFDNEGNPYLKPDSMGINRNGQSDIRSESQGTSSEQSGSESDDSSGSSSMQNHIGHNSLVTSPQQSEIESESPRTSNGQPDIVNNSPETATDSSAIESDTLGTNIRETFHF